MDITNWLDWGRSALEVVLNEGLCTFKVAGAAFPTMTLDRSGARPLCEGAGFVNSGAGCPAGLGRSYGAWFGKRGMGL